MRRTGMIVVLLIFAATGCAFAYNVADYMPMVVGVNWTYQDSSESGFDTTLTRIAGTATMLGYLTHIFIDSSIVTDTVDTSYMQLRSDGFYSLFTFEDGDTNFLAQLVVPNPFNIGDNWTVFLLDSTWDEGLYTYSQHIEMNGVAVALEPVNVPAGSFSNCIKITMTGLYTIFVLMGSDTMYSDEGSIGEHTIWLAEGVGPVKFYDFEPTDTTETYSVLLSYDFSGIDEKSNETPNSLSLKTSPNPFNSSVAITAPVGAKVEIYDLRGNVVCKIPSIPRSLSPRGERDDAMVAAGSEGQSPSPSGEGYRMRGFTWTPDQSISSGLYFVRATMADGGTITKRIVYLK